MPIRPIKEIEDCQTQVVDFGSYFVDLHTTQMIADAMRKNINIKKIILDLCGLEDGEIEPIFKVLIDKPFLLNEINLRNNCITGNSLPYIIKIMAEHMEKGATLDIGFNEGLTDKDSCLLELHKVSVEKELKLILDKFSQKKLDDILNRRKLKSYQFFSPEKSVSDFNKEKPVVEAKEIDDNSTMTPPAA